MGFFVTNFQEFRIIIKNKNMRELILNRIEELRKQDGFNKNLIRWRNLDVSGTHISVYNFDVCDDKKLVQIFEKIIRQYYKST